MVLGISASRSKRTYALNALGHFMALSRVKPSITYSQVDALRSGLDELTTRSQESLLPGKFSAAGEEDSS